MEESNPASDSHTQNTEDSQEETWIEWYWKQEGNGFLLQIEESYISDDFNLFNIRHNIRDFEGAMKMILSSEIPSEESK